MCICETAAQEHFLINTTTLCKAFFFYSSLKQKTNVRETTKSSTFQKRKENTRLPTLFRVSWNTVESVCLHLHTNVTFYLPRGWGRFYSLHRDALDKLFFPVWETSLCYTVRKWEETQCILLLVPSLSSFSLTCHWYAVICVSRLEHIGFVSISLKYEAVCRLKRRPGCRSCNYWGSLMIGLLDGRGLLW